MTILLTIPGFKKLAVTVPEAATLADFCRRAFELTGVRLFNGFGYKGQNASDGSTKIGFVVPTASEISTGLHGGASLKTKGADTTVYDSNTASVFDQSAIGTTLSFVLTAAGNASNGATVYTGTITGGTSSAYKHDWFLVAGFTTDANNGTFQCSASGTTSITLLNANGASETHAGTAVVTAVPTTAGAGMNVAYSTALSTMFSNNDEVMIFNGELGG